jgi:hypothetical protein
VLADCQRTVGLQQGSIRCRLGPIVLQLQDDPIGTAPLNGDYTLYLRIEREP